LRTEKRRFLERSPLAECRFGRGDGFDFHPFAVDFLDGRDMLAALLALLHRLVAVTGTLVFAMLLHTIYNLVAGS
jgi:hypothetical protein